MHIYTVTSEGNCYRYLRNLELCELGVIFADITKKEYQNSRNITKPLTNLYLEQTTEYYINREKLAKLKYNIKKKKFNVIQKGFKV